MGLPLLSNVRSGGVSWRSAAVVLLIALGFGMKLTVVDTAAVMSDHELAPANSVGTAVWDTTPPTAVSFKIPNGGGANNEPDVEDKIVIFFSEPIDLPTIKSGWDGSWTPVSVTIENNVSAYGNNDIVTFDVNLGVIDLGGKKYTKAPQSVFDARMKWNAPLLKVVVELMDLTVDETRETNAKTLATYYPDPAIEDTGHIAIDTSVTPTRNAKHF